MAHPVCLTGFHQDSNVPCLFKNARVGGWSGRVQQMEDSVLGGGGCDGHYGGGSLLFQGLSHRCSGTLVHLTTLGVRRAGPASTITSSQNGKMSRCKFSFLGKNVLVHNT